MKVIKDGQIIEGEPALTAPLLDPATAAQIRALLNLKRTVRARPDLPVAFSPRKVAAGG